MKDKMGVKRMHSIFKYPHQGTCGTPVDNIQEDVWGESSKKKSSLKIMICQSSTHM